MSIAERLGALYTKLSGILSACNTALTGKGAETVTQLDDIADAISAISAGTDTSDATAAAADVRQGKTFYAGGEKKTGSMAEAEPTYIFDPPTIENSGLLTYGVNLTGGYAAGGAHTDTHQLDTLSGMTITPGATKKGAATAGKYVLGDIWVEGDANLVPANIKQGVSIFGVSGSFAGYANIESGIHFGDGTNTATLETSFKPSYLVMASTVGHMAMNPKNSYLLLKLTAAGDGENNGTATYVRNPNGLQFYSGSIAVSFSSSGTVVTLTSTYQFANDIQYYWAAWT